MGGVPEAGVEGGVADGGWLLWVATSEKDEENGVEGLDITITHLAPHVDSVV